MKRFKIERICDDLPRRKDLRGKKRLFVYAVVRIDLRAANENRSRDAAVFVGDERICPYMRITVRAAHGTVGKKLSVHEYLVFVGCGEFQAQ